MLKLSMAFLLKTDYLKTQNQKNQVGFFLKGSLKLDLDLDSIFYNNKQNRTESSSAILFLGY